MNHIQIRRNQDGRQSPTHADFEILENSSTRLQIHHMAFVLAHVRAGEQPEQMRDGGKIRHLIQSR